MRIGCNARKCSDLLCGGNDNKPSELVIVAPQLEAGLYLVQVSTQYAGSSTLLKEPRTVSFDKTLTVAGN